MSNESHKSTEQAKTKLLRSNCRDGFSQKANSKGKYQCLTCNGSYSLNNGSNGRQHYEHMHPELLPQAEGGDIKRMFTKVSASETELRLMIFIASEYKSFKMVDSESFKRLAQTIAGDKTFTLPCSSTFKNRILDATYQLVLESIQPILQQAQAFSIPLTDGLQKILLLSLA
jgi:hypothetical protein